MLDPDSFVNHYGRELGNDYRYVETVDGTRLLIEIATGIVAEILGAPPSRTNSSRPPRRDVNIPPGHYPPPGSCRVWYPDRPPGHQLPPGAYVPVPHGAVLVGG